MTAPRRAGAWTARAVLVALMVVCALIAFGPALGLPYLYDDVDQLNALATLRFGQVSFVRWLFFPHSNAAHVLPLVRLGFWASTLLAGLDARPFHAALVVVHAVGAIACAALAFAVSRSRLAAVLAGVLYAGAAGGVGFVVVAGNTPFSISAVLLTCAFAVLLGRHDRRLLASIGVLALLGVSATWTCAAVAGVALPLFVFWTRGLVDVDRTRLGVAALALLVGMAALGYGVVHWQGVALPPVHVGWPGLRVTGWLLLTAPLRFVLCWFPDGSPSIGAIGIGALVAWTLLGLSLTRLDPLARRLILVLWSSAAAIDGLIGLMRPEISLSELFRTDRYYVYALLPLALQLGALGARAFELAARGSLTRGRVVAAAMIALLAIGVVTSRARLDAAIPRALVASYQRAFDQGRALLALIERRAAVRDPSSRLLLADGPLPFDGVLGGGMDGFPSGQIGLSWLYWAQHPGGLANVEWAFEIGADDARAEDELLDEWAASLGIETPACVVGARLRPAPATSWIDFGRRSSDANVVSGLYPVEQGYRWTGAEARLALTAGAGPLVIRTHAPLELMRRRWPDLVAARAEVRVDGVVVGEIRLPTSSEQIVRLPVGATPGATVSVVIVPDRVWRPSEIDPGSVDGRELGIALSAIGFEGAGSARGCLDSRPPR